MSIPTTLGGKLRLGSKRHEMFREIRKMNFEIVKGRKHYRVLDPSTGAQLAVLPLGQNAYGGGKNGVAVLVRLRRYRKSRDDR
jgi:hypothetical protein